MQKSRAFTLIETVIVAGLLAVLMAAVGETFVFYSNTIAHQDAAIQVSRGASAIINAVRSAGLQADAVTASYTFSGIDYQSGTSTVIFELPSVDTSGDIVSGSYDYIGITASGTDAYQFTTAASGSVRVSGEKLLTDVASDLTFSYNDPTPANATAVTVDATTSTEVKGVPVTTHLEGVAYLRNL